MTNAQTLAVRLSAGRLTVAEALRISASLADRLRQIHEEGRAHGALTPAAVVLTQTGTELQPASPAITPYTAPEVLQGGPPDARSDIFSLGAILYEMFTGERAFQGSDADTVSAAVLQSMPRPSGSPAVDRLVAGCVAKSPNLRFQRIQKVQLELHMVGAAARRAGLTQAAAPGSAEAAPTLAEAAPASPAEATPAAPPFEAAPLFPSAPLFASAPAAAAAPTPVAIPFTPSSSDLESLERRIAARFEEQERAVTSVKHAANEVLNALRGGGLAGGYERQPGRGYGVGMGYDTAGPMSRLDQAFQLLSDKVSRIDLMVATAVERLQKLEGTLDTWDADAAALRDSVTRDIRNFERTLNAQSAAIDSARTAMAQTDDLVERVVEAIDSLQSMFLTSAEERAAS